MTARYLLPVVLFAAAIAPLPAMAASVTVAAGELAIITDPETAESRALLRFELPDELEGVTVEFATVEYAASVSPGDTTGALTLDVFPVTTEWHGDTVGWADGWSTAGGDFDREVHAVWTALSGESSVVRFDVTDMVAGWLSGTHPNHGIIVRRAPGEAGAAVPVGSGGEHGDPVLTIWYTGPEGRGRQ